MTFYGTFASGAGWIVPKKYLESVGPDGFRKHPIGLGPYKFVSSTPGVDLVMEAYEGYWRKMPSVKRLVYKSVPEATTRMAMLKRGEVDLAYLLDAPMAEDVKRDPNLKLVFSGGIATYYLDFLDMWDPKSPWADRRVRLAANYAIDRKGLSQAETLGASPPTGNIVPRTFEFALAPRAVSLRSREGQAAAGRSRLSQRVRRGRPLPVAALLLGRRGDHERPSGRGHQDEGADDGARRLLRRARDEEAQRALHVSECGVRQCGLAHVGDGAERWRVCVRRLSRYRRAVQASRRGRPIAQKREAMLHEIQRLLHERVRFAPIFEYIWPSAVGPRVADPR